MIGDPVTEAPITWTICISNDAYDASGHVAAVDDDLQFKSPYINTKNSHKIRTEKNFLVRLCWGRFRESLYSDYLVSVELLDLNTLTWSNGTPMPIPSFQATSHVLGNELFVIGGRGEDYLE